MFMNKTKKTIILAALISTGMVANAAPSNQEIMDMMLELKNEVKQLKTENKALKGEVEDVAVATDEAIKAQVKLSGKTTIGGYGELHYNGLDDQIGNSDVDKIDFHRFVLFFNHEYSDKLRFVSELELEHSIAGDGKVGEVEFLSFYKRLAILTVSIMLHVTVLVPIFKSMILAFSRPSIKFCNLR